MLGPVPPNEECENGHGELPLAPIPSLIRTPKRQEGQ